MLSSRDETLPNPRAVDFEPSSCLLFGFEEMPSHNLLEEKEFQSFFKEIKNKIKSKVLDINEISITSF